MAAMTEQAHQVRDELADAAATRHAADVVQRSRTTFFWAMRRMPRDRREAMFAVYALCREVDDIADEPGGVTEKKAMLARYRDEIGRLYEGRDVELPAIRALAVPVAAHGLARQDFEAVIDGMVTDSEPAVRLADDAALDLYVDRVACAVGRLCCPIFGLPEADRAPLSRALGTALQLTNILRDVREDAARDRVYLPASRIEAVGLGGVPPRELADRPELAPVLEHLSDRVEASFCEADRIMDRIGGASVRPARMMRTAYGRLFDKVKAAGFRPLPKQRVRLGSAEKAMLLLRYGVF